MTKDMPTCHRTTCQLRTAHECSCPFDDGRRYSTEVDDADDEQSDSWHKVEDGYPDTTRDVLIKDEYGQYNVAFYDAFSDYGSFTMVIRYPPFIGVTDINVVAWHELPEPYVGDGE
jgi:hypothetical protein